MKKIYSSLSAVALFLIALILLTAPQKAAAQVFNGGTTVVGSSNAPVLVNFALQTNSAYSSLVARTLLIANVQSNSIVNVNYGYQWAGLGGTNLYIMNTLTTNFNGAGITNGGTCIIPISAFNNIVPISPWGTYQATNAAGNVTNTVTFY